MTLLPPEVTDTILLLSYMHGNKYGEKQCARAEREEANLESLLKPLTLAI